jgi:hypothetical protein
MADLVRLYVKCSDRPSKIVSFKCAVTSQTYQPLLLAANVVNCSMTSLVVCNTVVQNDDSSDSDCDENGDNCNIDNLNVSNCVPDDNNSVKALSGVDNLRDEQLSDDSLHNCFSLARQGKFVCKRQLVTSL